MSVRKQINDLLLAQDALDEAMANLQDAEGEVNEARKAVEVKGKSIPEGEYQMDGCIYIVRPGCERPLREVKPTVVK